MNKKILIDALAMAALALVVVVGYKLSPLVLPKADVSLAPPSGCDLQKNPCGVALPGGGTLSFSILPRPIPLLAPLQLEVALSGREASKVEVDFAGVDMDMGFNRTALANQGGGRYTGAASLPVCASGGMDWQATVMIESGQERIAVPFRFAARRG